MVKKDREDDLSFLEDQRGARVGWMSGRDHVFGKRIEKQAQKRDKADYSEEE
jgi:hypothetical protein